MPSTDILALTALTLLGLGGALLCVLMLLPGSSKAAREAWPIYLTELVIVGCAVGALWWGGWVLLTALVLHAGRVIYEVRKVTGFRSPLFVLFPGVPLVFFTGAGLQPEYAGFLLLAFMLVETFDSYALLGGKLFGRRKAFPTLSPRKTVEGLVAGALMLVITAAIGAPFLGASVYTGVVFALITAPLAIAGDLGASWLKRQAGVKDYPQILPRQGGLFDITDAWIVTGTGFVLLELIGFAWGQ